MYIENSPNREVVVQKLKMLVSAIDGLLRLETHALPCLIVESCGHDCRLAVRRTGKTPRTTSVGAVIQ